MLKHRTTRDSRSIDFEQDSCTPDWIQSLDRPVDEVAEHKADEPSVRFCLSALSALRGNDGTVTRTKPEPNLNLRRKVRVPRTTGVAEGDFERCRGVFHCFKIQADDLELAASRGRNRRRVGRDGSQDMHDEAAHVGAALCDMTTWEGKAVSCRLTLSLSLSLSLAHIDIHTLARTAAGD